MLLKLVKTLINLFFWLWLFAIPAGISLFISFITYKKYQNNILFPLAIASTGIFIGILLAESVRKKYGLDFFFGKLLSTPQKEKTGRSL